MIHKMFASNGDKVLVTFELPGCIWATQVYLVGDFNHWDAATHPLRQRDGGEWTITLELDAHTRYEFRYLLDGTDWVNDDHADDYVFSSPGSENSVVNCACREIACG